MEIKVLKPVLDKNADKAREIRACLNKNSVLMLNLISSPGSGKTTLLEKTLPLIMDSISVAVIEGDIATDRDAQRLKKHGIPVILVNTGGGCYLNSQTIEKAIAELDLKDLDLIFIENVGNMVCPSEFDLGEDSKIGITSVAEGDDKPAKYPLLFQEAGIAILNKIDLFGIVPFNLDSFYEDIRSINPTLPVYELSCLNQKGMEKWISWIKKMVDEKKKMRILNNV